MRSVVISGCSTGIGASTAKVLIKRGLRVFGGVGQQADGERLRRDLGDRFEPLYFDVTDRLAVDAAAALVGQKLDGQ
jgi:NAD(P)-dependent dehydrogenase (short-subunit alcohol dehydrogenase family)